MTDERPLWACALDTPTISDALDRLGLLGGCVGTLPITIGFEGLWLRRLDAVTALRPDARNGGRFPR